MADILQIADEHLSDDQCECELFSDMHKDITGYRPRGEWTCQQVKDWHDEHVEDPPGSKNYTWRHPELVEH